MYIEYIKGDKSILKQTKHMWQALSDLHMEKSKDFKESFAGMTFEARMERLPDKVQIVIGKYKGETVAYIISSINDDNIGEIDSLYVSDLYRGYKIGDRLMNEALSWLQGQNPKKVIIGVAAGNESAFKFYERYGYKPKVTILERV